MQERVRSGDRHLDGGKEGEETLGEGPRPLPPTPNMHPLHPRHLKSASAASSLGQRLKHPGRPLRPPDSREKGVESCSSGSSWGRRIWELSSRTAATQWEHRSAKQEHCVTGLSQATHHVSCDCIGYWPWAPSVRPDTQRLPRAGLWPQAQARHQCQHGAPHWQTHSFIRCALTEHPPRGPVLPAGARPLQRLAA